jgi:YD repeat-containing protein
LTERSYAVRGFLTGIRNGGPAVIQDLTYQPDAAGLLQQVTSSLPNVPHESWSYLYDDLHRLTSATDLSSSESQTWTLDSIGRITFNSRVGSYAYGPTRSHAPSSVAGNPYSYDLNGNLTSGGGRSPQWNVYNQPTSIRGAAVPVRWTG